MPKRLQDKLLSGIAMSWRVQARLQRAYTYRKQVLAIFDELVTRERSAGCDGTGALKACTPSPAPRLR